ncbi:MAG: lipid-A-disaccharide synthase [Bacteroidales bacterium]
MKYFIVAGELSGDMHGASLMRGIIKKDANAEFSYMGGDLMQEVSGGMIRHYRSTALMGIAAVLKNLSVVKQALDQVKKGIVDYEPDAIILIDFPSFNIKIAKFAKKRGIKVFYYISPKIWAWKTWRIKSIKKYVDKMLTIFPFETDFYKAYGMDVEYVGNPLLDNIRRFKDAAVSTEQFIVENGLDPHKKIIALLPGSRNHELRLNLQIMLEAVKDMHDFQFVIGATHAVPHELYKEITADYRVQFVNDKTYDLLNNAHAALVTSGTATLETGLIGCPQVVLFYVKNAWFFKYIWKYIIKVKWASLVNLILNKEAVKELIVQDCTVENTRKELQNILDGPARDMVLEDYKRLNELLLPYGAADNAGRIIVDSVI